MSSPTPIPIPPAIRRRPIAEEISDALAREILLGLRPVGTPLPPERELAQHFGVSRLILRQAVHRLAAMELVRVRQGGASVVLAPEDSDHPEVGALLLRFCPENPDQLAALRERQVAGSLGMLILASHRITPKQVQRLQEILADHAGEPKQFYSIATTTVAVGAVENSDTLGTQRHPPLIQVEIPWCEV